MEKLLNIAIVLCLAFGITAGLAGCNQEKRHENVVNTQPEAKSGDISGSSSVTSSNNSTAASSPLNSNN